MQKVLLAPQIEVVGALEIPQLQRGDRGRRPREVEDARQLLRRGRAGYARRGGRAERSELRLPATSNISIYARGLCLTPAEMNVNPKGGRTRSTLLAGRPPEKTVGSRLALCSGRGRRTPK